MSAANDLIERMEKETGQRIDDNDGNNFAITGLLGAIARMMGISPPSYREHDDVATGVLLEHQMSPEYKEEQKSEEVLAEMLMSGISPDLTKDIIGKTKHLTRSPSSTLAIYQGEGDLTNNRKDIYVYHHVKNLKCIIDREDLGNCCPAASDNNFVFSPITTPTHTCRICREFIGVTEDTCPWVKFPIEVVRENLREAINNYDNNKIPIEDRSYGPFYFDGLISFEQDVTRGMRVGSIGVQVSNDGRVWVCIDGVALIRLKPTP